MRIKALTGDHPHDGMTSTTDGLVLVIHNRPDIRRERAREYFVPATS